MIIICHSTAMHATYITHSIFFAKISHKNIFKQLEIYFYLFFQMMSRVRSRTLCIAGVCLARQQMRQDTQSDTQDLNNE